MGNTPLAGTFQFGTKHGASSQLVPCSQLVTASS